MILKLVLNILLSVAVFANLSAKSDFGRGSTLMLVALFSSLLTGAILTIT